LFDTTVSPEGVVKLSIRDGISASLAVFLDNDRQFGVLDRGMFESRRFKRARGALSFQSITGVAHAPVTRGQPSWPLRARPFGVGGTPFGFRRLEHGRQPMGGMKGWSGKP